MGNKLEHKEDEQKIYSLCGTSICARCLCYKCLNNCEARIRTMTEEEWKKQDTCFNCDDCYFYGMDDSSLSRNVVKFKCENFSIMKYYADLYARKNRKKLKVR